MLLLLSSIKGQAVQLTNMKALIFLFGLFLGVVATYSYDYNNYKQASAFNGGQVSALVALYPDAAKLFRQPQQAVKP